MSDSCATCKFAIKDESVQEGFVLCRRHPPTVIASPKGPMAFFPCVSETLCWCGDFVKKLILQ